MKSDRLEELDVPAATFQTIASSNGPSTTQIVSLRFLAETRRIAAVMRGGDVIMVSIEEEGTPVRLFSKSNFEGS